MSPPHTHALFKLRREGEMKCNQAVIIVIVTEVTHCNLNFPFADCKITVIVDKHPLKSASLLCLCIFNEKYNSKSTFKKTKKKSNFYIFTKYTSKE